MKRRTFLATAAGAAVAPLLIAERGVVIAAAAENTTPETAEPSPYKALLRYYIGEDFDVPERTRRVCEFCRRVGIDGVMLFSAAYERQPFVLTRDEYVRRAAAMGEAARIIREHGLIVEINVQITCGHHDPGKRSSGAPFPFQTMVNYDGRVADAIPCPLDPKYVALMADFYAEQVRQVRPDVIYADDDFRLTNHGPTIEMGCFCPLHLKRLAAAIGKPEISLADARGLLFEEKPDMVERRMLFAQVMEESMMGVVKAIRKAIDEIEPKTRFGFMMSVPPSDLLTGKPYDRLSKAAAGNTRPIIRPNLGMYEDGERRLLPLAVDRTFWSRAVAGPDTEMITEVDGCWPHSRFRRSAATVINNVVSTTFGGVSTQSLFLFGFLDTPFDDDPEYGDALQKHLPMFRALARLVDGYQPFEGIRLWYDHERSVFCKRTPVAHPDSFDFSRDWINRLALNGLPLAYADEGPAILQGNEGDTITADQLRAELKKGLYIEGAAAKKLLNRGFGGLIGIDAMQDLDVLVTTEHLDVAEFAGPYFGRRISVGSGVTPRGHFFRLVPKQGARTASTLFELDKNPMGPGLVVFENLDGGRVAVTANGRNGEARPPAFTNHGRQEQLRAVFEWLGRKPLPVAVEHTPDLWVMIRRKPDKKQVAVMAANLSFDPVPKPVLTVGNLAAGQWTASRLMADGTLARIGQQNATTAKTTFRLTSQIEPQEAAVFVLDRAD